MIPTRLVKLTLLPELAINFAIALAIPLEAEL
jgi:hypothetical protein